MPRYKLTDVVEMTGITRDQIRYAERHGHVQTGRPRRFCHYRYTDDEVARFCRWFGMDVPKQLGSVGAESPSPSRKADSI